MVSRLILWKTIYIYIYIYIFIYLYKYIYILIYIYIMNEWLRMAEKRMAEKSTVLAFDAIGLHTFCRGSSLILHQQEVGDRGFPGHEVSLRNNNLLAGKTFRPLSVGIIRNTD